MGLWIPPLLAAEVHFEDRLGGPRSYSVFTVSGFRLPRCSSCTRYSAAVVQTVILDLEKRREAMRGASVWKRWWVFCDVHRWLGFKFWALAAGRRVLPADIEEFCNLVGFLVVQGLGMMETTALASLNHPFRASKGTLGQVLPGREIRLTPEGEVLVRGETVSQTVWQAGGPQQLESDWLPTGDLANRMKQGNLHFRGRKKDVIVTEPASTSIRMILRRHCRNSRR